MKQLKKREKLTDRGNKNKLVRKKRLRIEPIANESTTTTTTKTKTVKKNSKTTTKCESFLGLSSIDQVRVYIEKYIHIHVISRVLRWLQTTLLMVIRPVYLRVKQTAAAIKASPAKAVTAMANPALEVAVADDQNPPPGTADTSMERTKLPFEGFCSITN